MFLPAHQIYLNSGLVRLDRHVLPCSLGRAASATVCPLSSEHPSETRDAQAASIHMRRQVACGKSSHPVTGSLSIRARARARARAKAKGQQTERFKPEILRSTGRMVPAGGRSFWLVRPSLVLVRRGEQSLMPRSARAAAACVVAPRLHPTRRLRCHTAEEAVRQLIATAHIGKLTLDLLVRCLLPHDQAGARSQGDGC